MSDCIIVEGPDGSGKSTLLKILETRLGVIAKHDGGPPGSEQDLRNKLLIPHNIQLMDRWAAISDQVYAKVLRGGCIVPENEMMERILHYSPQIIYCRPPNATLHDNLIALDANKKSYKSEAHCNDVRKSYWEIVMAYDILMKQLVKMGLLVTMYDYTGEMKYEY